jgi:peptide/nickel transport system permease protein
MSSVTPVSTALPPPVPTTPEAAVQAPRSWIGNVLLRTVGRTGARIGLAWIAIVAFCAVFAPFLANSRPILIKMDGQWSSPLVQYLTMADVTLLALVLAAAVILPVRRASLQQRVLLIAAVTVLSLVLGMVFVQPPRVVAHEQWREAEEAGQVEWVLRTPIPYSPTDRLRDQFELDRPHPWAPATQHLLGTDRNGADILSQIIHASRIALAIGFIATGIAAIIGVIIGGLMGYFSGWVDLVGMRLVEIFGSIPTIYLLLAFVAFFGRDLYLMMVIIGLVSWTGDARFIRAEFLKLRGQDFVHAAVATGLPLWRVLYRHILPNAMAPLLVSASFGVASAILFESTLSFLGLGLIDAPSWGALLNQAVRAGGGFHWWLAIFPGLLIFLTVFSYNLVGESVRDAIDPHTRRLR